MKALKHSLIVILLISTTALTMGQSMIEAGPDQTIYCSGSVQLKVTPMNSWAFHTQAQPFSFSLSSVSFQSPQMAFAVGGNSVFRIHQNRDFFPDGQMLGTGSGTLSSICFVDYLKGFICGSGGSIYSTTDGGNMWNPMTSGTTNSLRSIFFVSSTIGYVAGANGTILKTTNGGSSWSSLNSGTTSTLYSVFFINSEIGYVTGSAGTLLKTIDSGLTWTLISTGVTNTLYSVDFPTPTKGIIVGSGGTILKTIDGTTWDKYIPESVFLETESGIVSTTISRSLSTLSFSSVKFISETTGYIGGSYFNSIKGVFLKTIDGGNTWFEQPSNGASKINAICFDSEKKVGYAVGSSGKVYKATSGDIQPLVYNWSSPETLSDPSIANPIASPTSTTMYTVFAYDPSDHMNSFIDSVKVSVVPLTLNMGNNKVIGCEGSVKLDSATTNYIGSEKLRYKWTPSTGLSNDTIPNPIVSVTTNTTYYLTVTKSNNCSANGQVTVNISPLIITATVDKELVCRGTAQLSATTNYTGTSTLHYKWTPSTGLSNDTIPNPTATVNSTTVYTLAVNSDTGCSATKEVTVKVNNLSANAGTDKSVICGGSVQLDAVTTNYQETGVVRYKWTPSTGLNNDTIAAPVATVNSQTVYTVTVYSPNDCSATDNVTVGVTPLTVNAGVDKIANCGEPVQLGVTTTNYSGTGLLKYKWTPITGLSNDTISNPVAIADNSTYTVTITTPSGCSTSDNVAITVASLDKPSIIYVGINGNNKNILAWRKPVSNKIDSFNIYRETNVTNSFSKIGSVAYDSEAFYADTLSMPDVQSNKYKISILDKCGVETNLSDYHKTMHLSINKGVNLIWNLIWEAYEGYPVSTYNIYRGTTPSNIQIIGSLSGSNTQFSDYTAPAGYVYYQIEAISSTASGVNSQVKAIQGVSNLSSRSNVASNKGDADGLYNPRDISDKLVVTPNPASGKVKVVIEDNLAKDMQLSIYNSIGLLVKVQYDIVNSQIIDVSTLSNGVYTMVVKSQNFKGIHKLLIKK